MDGSDFLNQKLGCCCAFNCLSISVRLLTYAMKLFFAREKEMIRSPLREETNFLCDASLEKDISCRASTTRAGSGRF